MRFSVCERTLAVGIGGGGVAVNCGGRGEERCGEAFPDLRCVKGKEEFYCRAGVEWGEESVDGAMDVVEGKDMEQVVF